MMLPVHRPQAPRIALVVALGVAVVAVAALWLAFHRGDQVVPLPDPTTMTPVIVPTAAPPTVTVTAPDFDPTEPTAPTVVSTTSAGEVVVVVTTRNP